MIVSGQSVAIRAWRQDAFDRTLSQHRQISPAAAKSTRVRTTNQSALREREILRTTWNKEKIRGFLRETSLPGARNELILLWGRGNRASVA
jgi:hypothetical protein